MLETVSSPEFVPDLGDNLCVCRVRMLLLLLQTASCFVHARSRGDGLVGVVTLGQNVVHDSKMWGALVERARSFPLLVHNLYVDIYMGAVKFAEFEKTGSLATSHGRTCEAVWQYKQQI